MKARLIIIYLIVCVSLGFSMDSSVWQKKGQGIYEFDVQSILVDPSVDDLIYAGTLKALYRSVDGGRTYQSVLRLSGEQKGINDIYIPPDRPEMIYAATDAGLYESRNKGKDWQRIFQSSDAESVICHSVIVNNHTVYLGTQKGLFQKTDQETVWRKMKGSVDNKPVYRIVEDESFLYMATGQTLFRLNKQTKNVESVFSLGVGEGRGMEEVLDETSEDREELLIKFIRTADFPRAYIFVASSKGIYFSADHGKDWRALPADNLALGDLITLLIFKDDISNGEGCTDTSVECFELLAGTKKGVFFLSHGKWMSLYKGMETNGINDLAKDMRGTVYVATEKGIFYLPIEKALPSFNHMRDFDMTMFDREPSISEVQRLAVDYAEVSHEKIKDWRRLARTSAWLPSLDVGVDGSRDWNSSDSIWGSYTSGGQLFIGPDDKTRGEDFGWGASLSWDLADLVWSTDQTTIDSRSKLMVELREDILNEVTRLYFERRRMQIGIASNSFADPGLKVDQEMRVAELTALIDALTGGEFSKIIH